MVDHSGIIVSILHDHCIDRTFPHFPAARITRDSLSGNVGRAAAVSYTLLFPIPPCKTKTSLATPANLAAKLLALLYWQIGDWIRRDILSEAMGGIRNSNYLYAVETIDGVGSNAWP